MTHLDTPSLITLALLVLLAAAADIRTRRIPNPLTATGAIAGFILNTALHGIPGARSSLLGLALGAALFLPLFLLRGRGGGDLKLMAAAGAIAGPSNTLLIFVLTAITGAILALVLLLSKGSLSTVLRNCALILHELAHLRPPYQRHPELALENSTTPKLPYAIPIAIGTILFLAIAS
ncbi:MAG: prepilin peptidase [Bryobacterales bacterium]|nr:prepilin peptidase [Bryobacterales bacterium]